MIIFNVTEEPVEEKILCYYVDELNGYKENEYILKAVVEETYRHPKAPDHGYIQKLNTKIIKRVEKRTYEEAPLRLLLNANQTIEIVLNGDKNVNELTKRIVNSEEPVQRSDKHNDKLKKENRIMKETITFIANQKDKARNWAVEICKNTLRDVL